MSPNLFITSQAVGPWPRPHDPKISHAYLLPSGNDYITFDNHQATGHKMFTENTCDEN